MNFSRTRYWLRALPQTPPPSFQTPYKIKFPQRNPLVPQQIVRRGDMEVEIRQRKVQQVALPRELPLLPGRLQDNLRVLLAVHAVLRHRLEVLNRLLDARLELLKGGFVVGHCNAFDAADARGGVFGAVAGSLDLEGEGSHVVDQAGFEELGGGDVPGEGGLQSAKSRFQMNIEVLKGVCVWGIGIGWGTCLRIPEDVSTRRFGGGEVLLCFGEG